MKFSQHLWDTVSPIYQKIIRHPFNVELSKGSLNKERFIFYMMQDSYYLIHFSRVLALIAGKSVSSEITLKFLNCSISALCTERELHNSFLSKNYNEKNINPTSACLAYITYLMAMATTGSLEEAISAILPCFWIYKEVGLHIEKHSLPNNPYKNWIDTYSDEQFCFITEQLINLLDELSQHCSQNTLNNMQQAFEYSTLYEWHFWNDSYKMNLFKNSHQSCDFKKQK